MNKAMLGAFVYGALSDAAPPVLVRKVPLPNTIGHFDHVAATGGVAFMCTKNNVSYAGDAGEVTAVRYDSEKDAGVIGTFPIDGCNPQGIVVLSPDTIVTSCDSSGDFAVLGWDGKTMTLKGKTNLPGGDSDDIWLLNDKLVVVSQGDDDSDPAGLAYVSIADPTKPSVTRVIKTGGHPEAFRPLGKGLWAVNVPDNGKIVVVEETMGSIVREWDIAAGGCNGGNYAMAVPKIDGVQYLTIACRAKNGSKARLMVWRADDITKVGPKAVVPKPMCELKGYDQCDDLHATADGSVYAAMGTIPTGHLMKYGPSKEDGCPLKVEWEVETPGTGSRTCELEGGELILASPSPGGYNGTARGDAYLSVYKLSSEEQPTFFA